MTNRTVTVQSLAPGGGVRSAVSGVAASVAAADGKEVWTLPAWGRSFAPKPGDRLIPIATEKARDKRPRTVAAAAEIDGGYQLTCDAPKDDR
ncbi:unnamed protein product [Gemmataceae bacterium]|nr:unnamed protein product [Gemmataceae bacterium]VTT98939.1 unnamed protein product [Gemmataceae bacterium]